MHTIEIFSTHSFYDKTAWERIIGKGDKYCFNQLELKVTSDILGFVEHGFNSLMNLTQSAICVHVIFSTSQSHGATSE